MTVQPDTNTLAATINSGLAHGRFDRTEARAALFALLARCEEAEATLNEMKGPDVRTCVHHLSDTLLGETCAVCEAEARAERAERVVEAAKEVAKLWTPEREGVEWFANAMHDLRVALAASGPDTPA